MLKNMHWSMNGIEEINQDSYTIRTYIDRPQSLSQALENSARRFPRREIITNEQTRLSYKEFQEKVDRLASALSEQFDIMQGDRIAFVMGNHWRWLLTFMAIARAGAISVPLNNRLQGPELAYQINNTQACLLILDQEFQVRIDSVREDLKTVNHFIVNGSVTFDGMISFEKIETFPHRAIRIDSSENDVACILFTSGTTGLPKGAMLTHRNMISIAMAVIDILQYNEHDRMLFFIPIFHVTGLVGMFLPMMIAGGANVILPDFDRHSIPKIIEEEKITATMGVPATFLLIMDSPNYNKYSRSTMRAILYGGAPSPPDMHKKLENGLPKNCILGEGYGLSEASSNVTITPVLKSRQALHRHGTIGVANTLTDLRVIGNEGRDVQNGEIGELLVRSAGVMKGYWEDEEKTIEAIQDGWLHTGDLVSRDQDGYFTIKGRKKHMINRGGENIYPVEVENVLYAHPDILEAAVVGIPDPVMGEEVKAVIVLKEGIVLDTDQIKEFLKPRLADYKTPKQIVFANELPRNPAGKVMVEKLMD